MPAPAAVVRRPAGGAAFRERHGGSIAPSAMSMNDFFNVSHDHGTPFADTGA